MIDPGKMRNRILFQAFNGDVDDLGDIRDDDPKNWRNVRTVWAAIDPVSGREFYEAEQSQSQVTHKIRCRYFPIRCRYFPDAETAQPILRILYHRRIFQIVSIIDWEERHESYLIMAKELVR